MSGNDKVRVRNIGIVCPGEGTTVWVDHVWYTRPRGRGRRDEGAVGLMLEAGGQQLGAFLGPEDAADPASAGDVSLHAPVAGWEYDTLTRNGTS